MARARTVVGILVIGALWFLQPEGASASGGDGSCKSVQGKFEAFILPPEACDSPVGLCTVGELGGNLKGGYEFTMKSLIPSPDPQTPSVTFFSGRSLVSTHKGDEYVGVDNGAIDLAAPGTLNAGKFSTLLNFVEGAGGHLWIRGRTDLVNGTVSGRYSGEVCPE